VKALLVTTFLFSIVLFNKEATGVQIESDHFELTKLGDGVYSCIHKFGGKAICNVGIVDNGKETLIFDTFLSPDVAQELLTLVKRLELSPVKYVVNSHFHNDHIRGNQVFSDDVKIISTLKTREIIEEEEPLQIAYEKEHAPARFSYYDSLYHSFKGDQQSREYQQTLMWRPYYQTLSESHLKVKTRLPNLYVDSTLSLNGPKRSIQLISYGEGHTESDLVLYLPDDQILFSGDLIFNECHPYVPHGNISKWQDWLKMMNTLEVNTIMPGHGQMGTSGLIEQMMTYLQDLETAAKNFHDKSLKIEEIDSIVIPEKYNQWWFDRFYEYNIKFAYEALQEVKNE
jgi:glyoxylase-like metal-dependent hydrolase (beta-lactamase superfamily II)